MAKNSRVVHQEEWGKIVIMDSAAELKPDEKDQVVVAGSHGSEFAARYIVRFEPYGIILNDAGRGKNDAGISGLPVFQVMNILAATVDCMSARIGEGEDTYNNGRISALNQLARKVGVEEGMSVREATRLMLMHQKKAATASGTSTVFETDSGRIVLADTISYLFEDHSGSVVVSGSHCAHTTYDWVKKLGLKGIFLNDAGRGKDNQGISGLPLYQKGGIPAGTVDCMSARIGDARDAWDWGIISAVNELAEERGITEGMTVQEAARKIIVREKDSLSES